MAASSRSRLSVSRRATSDSATHEGIAAVDTAGTDLAIAAGGPNGSAGMVVRPPRNGFQSLPSKRHLPSREIASFHFIPSQNQFRSRDQPV